MDSEPQVSIITRQYVEIGYTFPDGHGSKVIMPLSEVNDVVVELASLLKSDAPPVIHRGPGSTGA